MSAHPKPLYFDYAATTPVDERVANAMVKCLTFEGNFGNPASRSHFYGWQAEQVVEEARLDVANLINADAREIVFTSGATEANNLAIKGAVQSYQTDGFVPHIITSSIEHKAVLDTCADMLQKGCEVTYVQPNTDGSIELASIASAIKPNTVLLSFMHVNNETGVITDIEQIGRLCLEHGCLLHVDASQGAGKLPIDVNVMHIDLLSISAHKLYGPKGVGALFVRRKKALNISAQIHGGGHERGMRSGTLATHQIVGLGQACKIAKQQLQADIQKYAQLQSLLLSELNKLSLWDVNAKQANRVANIVNIAVQNVDGEVLLSLLHDVALSTGSACTSASVEPSYVLKAIGVPDALAHSSLRISFGRYTNPDDVCLLVEKIYQAVTSLRSSAA